MPAIPASPGRLRPFLVAGLVTGLLFQGCSSPTVPGKQADATRPSTGSESPEPGSGSDRYEVTDGDFAAMADVMDGRAEALLSGRRAAFLSTVDPRNERLVTRQGVFFDNVQALPVDDVFYRLSNDSFTPVDLPGDAPATRPRMFEHLSLKGVLDHPVANRVSITFVKRGTRWLVGAETVDRMHPPQDRPWFGGPIDVAKEGGLLTVTDAGAEVTSAELSVSVREQLASVADLLDEPERRRLLVDATSNGLTHELSSASGETAAAVAMGLFAGDDLGEDDGGLAGAAIKMNPKRVAELVGEIRILRHELTHYLLDGFGRTVPIWATEGIAEYSGSYPLLLANSVGTPELIRKIEKRPVKLTSAGVWGYDPPLDYLVARATAEFLVQTYGMARYREMLRTFRRDSGLIDYGDDIVGQTLRKVYDLSAREVARETFELLAVLDR